MRRRPTNRHVGRTPATRPGWIRALLRLLPADVRGDLGRDIEATLTDEVQEARTFGQRLRVMMRNTGAFFRFGVPLHAVQTWQDLRLGLRALAAAPIFTVVALAALALGVGGAATTFSIADGFLFKPLPFADPERLVHLWGDDRTRGLTGLRVAVHEFDTWARLDRVFDGAAFFNYLSEELTGGPAPERVATARVSTNVFAVLGVAPGLGRGFLDGEDRPGAEPVAVISDRFWRTRYGGRVDVLDQRLELGGIGHRIVGVMPVGFAFPLPMTDVWAPRTIDRSRLSADSQSLQVLARLKPGVTREQAAAATAQASADLAAIEPRLAGRRADIVPLREALNFAHQIFAVGAAVVGVANLLVLLTVCANISSLMLSRAIRRGREAAIRASLGASRLRLVRQYTTESLVLGLAGGALGALIASWWIGIGNRAIPNDLFRAADFAVDGRTWAVVLLLSLGTTMAFGLVPAIRLARTNLADAMRQDGGAGTASRRSLRLQSGLVAAQVALSIVLLAGTLLVVRSVSALAAVDPGFRSDGVLTMQVMLPRQRYETGEAAGRFQDDTLEWVNAVPGVTAAAFVNLLPLNHESASREFTPAGWTGSGRLPSAYQYVVGAEYFAVLGITVIEGRVFDTTDRAAEPQPVVINESMARRYWPDRSAVGSTIQFTNVSAPVVVIGVVADTLQADLADRGRNQLFLAQSQTPGTHLRLLVATTGDPMLLAPAVVGAIHRVDPLLPVVETRSLASVVEEYLLPHRALRATLAALGILSLGLTVLGIYGIVMCYVTERTREMGIRLAVGADARRIARYVVGRGVRLALWGAAIGMPLAVVTGVAMRGMLFGVSTASPLMYLAVGTAVIVVAALASFVPARRAARINPLTAMRMG